jgi:ribosomal protein L20
MQEMNYSQLINSIKNDGLGKMQCIEMTAVCLKENAISDEEAYNAFVYIFKMFDY